MQKFRFDNYKTPIKSSILTKDKSFRVFLFWSRTLEFTNKKETVVFLRKLSKNLTNIFYELINVNVNCINEYFRFFPYLKTSHDIKKLLICFNQINEITGNIFNTNQGFESLFHAVNHTYKIINLLFEIIEILIALRLDKNHYAEVRYLKMYLNKLKILKYKLDTIEKI